MNSAIRTAVAVVALATSLVNAAAQTPLDAISPKALSVERLLQSLDVEHHWIAGAHVNWESGEPDDPSQALPGRHTHCSAFVALAAKRLGIYILRPPQHGQVLLANAQNEWLASDGLRQGWSPVDGPVEAQALANAGDFVVAGYRSHDEHRPGHIAIVLPGRLSAAELEDEGPHVMQASTTNSASISLRAGFANHPHAWADGEVRFYAHAVDD